MQVQCLVSKEVGKMGHGLMSAPKFLLKLLALILHSVSPLCPDCNPKFIN